MKGNARKAQYSASQPTVSYRRRRHTVDRLASTRTFLDAALPFVLLRLVVCFLPARLLVLNLTILVFESACLLLSSEDFLCKCSLALFVLDATSKEFCWPLLNGAHLTILWSFHWPVVLFVVAMRIEHISHLDELNIAFELGSHLSLGQTVPGVASSGLFLLFDC